MKAHLKERCPLGVIKPVTQHQQLCKVDRQGETEIEVEMDQYLGLQLYYILRSHLLERIHGRKHSCLRCAHFLIFGSNVEGSCCLQS